jgi:hypothetical protein
MAESSTSYLKAGATLQARLNGEVKSRKLTVLHDRGAWWVMDKAWQTFPASLIVVSTVRDVTVPKLG